MQFIKELKKINAIEELEEFPKDLFIADTLQFLINDKKNKCVFVATMESKTIKIGSDTEYDYKEMTEFFDSYWPNGCKSIKFYK